jgi:hypothetical protein
MGKTSEAAAVMVTDYYAMLGVDPGADRATLEAALARNQPIWSSGTRNPKNKHTYQSYLDQIPALRRTLLGDLAVRAAYDAELAAARRVERDQKLDELQRMIRLRAAKGGLTAADRTLLCDEAVKLGLLAEDLDRLAGPVPTLAADQDVAEDDEPDPPADILDATTRRQIRVALEHLRRRDLFDALGLPHDAPAVEISAKADAERQRWMQKTQVTAEKTAWLEVVSLAQSHLGTTAARGRYERTLAMEREETFKGSIEFAVKGLSGLDGGTISVLLDAAAALGIGSERAERLIGRACRALGVARAAGEVPARSRTSAALRLIRCRVCAGVTDYGQAARGGAKGAECRHCRVSLRWDCPLCRRQYWVDEPRCGCGFRLADREPLLRHFEAAQHAFKARDFAAALEHLKRVQDFAPTHAGARKGIEKIRQRHAEIDRARAKFETAQAGAYLVAAATALAAWERLANPAAPELKAARAAVAQAHRDAMALVARARPLETVDPPAARALYRQALKFAADWPEARTGLLRCPPDPPTELRAECAGDRIKLHWTPPAPDGVGPVTYAVLRKPAAPFTHPADGTRIAEVSEPAFDDTDVVPGATVSYAVVTLRNETETASMSAVTLGPIPLLADVRDVCVAVRSGAVDLSWSLPTAAADVRVVRRCGSAPSGPKDGERVEALREAAHDRGLQDDQVYHYAIYALYRMPDGTLLAARGVPITAQPHPAVAAPAAPLLTQEQDGRVRLTWEPPLRGTIKILRTPRPPELAPGDRLSTAAAAALEGHWLDPSESTPDSAIDPAPPPLGVCYYTPMTLWGGTLTVGHAALSSCVPDPSELRATRLGHGNRVHLRWRWSPQASQARVVARAGRPPEGPYDPQACGTTVHEGQYGRQGRFTLALPEGEEHPWHVRVYSVASINGEEVVSPGLEASAAVVVPGPNPEVTVSYSFRRSSFPGRAWTLTFRTEPPGAAIPPTALVVHPRTLPLSLDDGAIVAEFPAARDGATFPIDSGIDLAKHRARVFADPRTGPEDLPPIRLHHPEAGVTRV